MAEPDYYTTLGLPRDATPEQVKRRFRKLAREHHPDVAGPDKEKHEFFIRLTEAYEVLGDAGRRAAYDLTLRDQDRLRAQIAARRAPPRPSPTTASGWPDATAPQPSRTSSAAQARAAAAQRRRVQVEQIVQAAQAAYSLGKLRDAIQLCRTALTLDRRSAATYELLGDIYARQRNVDQAIHHYTVAAQLTPHNGLLMAKLNRLLAREGGVAASSRAVGRARASQARARMLATQQVLIALVGGSVVISMVWLFASNFWQATNLHWWLVTEWTEKLLLLLVITGWVAGVTLALANIIGPLEEELLYSARGRGRRGVPIGLLLAVTGGLFLPLGVVVYGLFASVQQSASRSVVTVLALSGALTFAFAGISYSQDLTNQGWQTLMLGGNVLFLSMLGGWFIGDIFRPIWA